MNTLLRAVALLSTSVMASSCSAPPRDPANETPVELTPGNYHVTMAAGGMAGFVASRSQEGPGTIDDNICVKASAAADFPKNLARTYFAMRKPAVRRSHSAPAR